MPCNWEQRTDKESKSALQVETAIQEVIEKNKNMPIRAVAKGHYISKSSLALYISDAKKFLMLQIINLIPILKIEGYF